MQKSQSVDRDTSSRQLMTLAAAVPTTTAHDDALCPYKRLVEVEQREKKVANQKVSNILSCNCYVPPKYIVNTLILCFA